MSDGPAIQAPLEKGPDASAQRRAERWVYPIERSMADSEALAIILETLLGVMVDNQAGVIERRDQQFLHDYRVAVRRTRSALALFGGSLPEDVRARGKAFFKTLGARTTEARDLDVLLLELPGYARELPAADLAGVDELVTRLEGAAARRYADIREWLESREHCSRLAGWREDLARLRSLAGRAAVTRVVAGAIRKAAQAAHRQIEFLEEQGDEAALHRLRIRFKKLRYALEFARPLTPGGEAEDFIATLKGLQDLLGTHQDLVVHGERVGGLGNQASVSRGLERTAGLMAETLAARQAGLRREIEAEVAGFECATAAELGRVLSALA